MRGRVSPLSGLARLPIIIGNPACGRPVCPWGRVCPLSCLSRPLIYKKKPCLRPAWLSVGTRLLLLLKGNLAATGPPMCGDASVPYLTSPVLLLIRRKPCLRPACLSVGRVCPLSCSSRPPIIKKGTYLRPAPPMCGDASVPCLTSPVLLLIRRNPSCGRPGTRLSPVLPLSSSYC